MAGTIFTLEEIKEKIVDTALNYGIERVYLFGSYARGEANENSDLDFYIHKGRLSGLFQYAGFVEELEEEFGCHVDVVSGEIRDCEFRKAITEEMIPIFEEPRS